MGEAPRIAASAPRLDESTGGTAPLPPSTRVASSDEITGATLIQGDCAGDLWAWDVSEPEADPVLLWKLHFSDCIESTPAVYTWIVAPPPVGGANCADLMRDVMHEMTGPERPAPHTEPA